LVTTLVQTTPTDKLASGEQVHKANMLRMCIPCTCILCIGVCTCHFVQEHCTKCVAFCFRSRWLWNTV